MSSINIFRPMTEIEKRDMIPLDKNVRDQKAINFLNKKVQELETKHAKTGLPFCRQAAIRDSIRKFREIIETNDDSEIVKKALENFDIDEDYYTNIKNYDILDVSEAMEPVRGSINRKQLIGHFYNLQWNRGRKFGHSIFVPLGEDGKKGTPAWEKKSTKEIEKSFNNSQKPKI